MSKVLQGFVFLVLCLFIFGGALNPGQADCLPALPFLALASLAAVTWRGYYPHILLAVVLLAGGLEILKARQSSLIFPAAGRAFVTTKDVYITTMGDIVDESGMSSGVRTTHFVNSVRAGSQLVVASVFWSEDHFCIHYKAPDKSVVDGTIAVPPDNAEADGFVWLDGRQPIRQDSLCRFTWLSQLMNWPLLLAPKPRGPRFQPGRKRSHTVAEPISTPPVATPTAAEPLPTPTAPTATPE